MKLNLKIFVGIFTITATTIGVLSITNANANVVDGEAKKKKFVACEVITPGGPIQYGNTCDSGTATCYPNPCN